jgi:predicted DsbA family dithiol-disulfide isomerase
MASRALKAAGIVGGIDAHAAFHDWAFANQPELQNMDEGSWAALAAQEGMDPGTFVEVLMSPEVNRLIALDIAEFKRLGHRHLPTILIEQKFMPRWFLKDEPVIDRVLIEAKATRTQQP